MNDGQLLPDRRWPFVVIRVSRIKVCIKSYNIVDSRGGEGRGGEGRGGERAGQGRAGQGRGGEGRGGDCPHFPQTRTFVTAEPSRSPVKRVTG